MCRGIFFFQKIRFGEKTSKPTHRPKSSPLPGGWRGYEGFTYKGWTLSSSLFFSGGYTSVTCSGALKTSSYSLLLPKSAFHPQKQNGCKETYLYSGYKWTNKNKWLCSHAISSWSTAFASVTSVSFQKGSKIHAPLQSFASCQHLKSVNLKKITVDSQHDNSSSSTLATPESWMLSVPVELRIRICQRFSCLL